MPVERTTRASAIAAPTLPKPTPQTFIRGANVAYELIAQQRIKAYKLGGKTMIDLDSVDEFHASLPRVESRAG